MSISCVLPGSIHGRVISEDDDLGIENAFVILTSHADVRGTTGSLDGHFAFNDLLPGSYSLDTDVLGMDCPELSTNVHSNRTTVVVVRCKLPAGPLYVPRRIHIEGAWWYYRRMDSQTGSCPRPLPEDGTGSMSFDPSDNQISIVGMDPAVRIIGTYDRSSGIYTGTGRAVRADGSYIQTDVAGGSASTGGDTAGRATQLISGRGLAVCCECIATLLET